MPGSVQAERQLTKLCKSLRAQQYQRLSGEYPELILQMELQVELKLVNMRGYP